MEHIADKIPLLQSIPGNQVSRTLIISIKEYIESVCPRTAKISETIYVEFFFDCNISFLESPTLDKNSWLTAKVWKNFSDKDNQ